MIEATTVQEPCSCNNETMPVGTIGEETGGLTNKIFIHVEGNNLRVFNEAYPGFSGTTHINYCPICGRKLRGK